MKQFAVSYRRDVMSNMGSKYPIYIQEERRLKNTFSMSGEGKATLALQFLVAESFLATFGFVCYTVAAIHKYTYIKLKFLFRLKIHECSHYMNTKHP